MKKKTKATKTFNNIARLIREKRVNHPRKYSQIQLSEILGYKNGQFISNVERGLCSVPLRVLRSISSTLDIEPQLIKEALLNDYSENIDHHLCMNTSNGSVNYMDENASEESYPVSISSFKR